MKEFLEGLRDLLEDYDITLKTSNGIIFSTMKEDVYIKSDQINRRVISQEITKLTGKIK